MKYYIVILAILVSIMNISGCIKENQNEKQEKIYFIFYYSTSSNIQNTEFYVKIITNDSIVFNTTVVHNRGDKIYSEIASGKDYLVNVTWNGISAETAYTPNYSAVLFLVLNGIDIDFKVVMD